MKNTGRKRTRAQQTVTPASFFDSTIAGVTKWAKNSPVPCGRLSIARTRTGRPAIKWEHRHFETKNKPDSPRQNQQSNIAMRSGGFNGKFTCKCVIFHFHVWWHRRISLICRTQKWAINLRQDHGVVKSTTSKTSTTTWSKPLSRPDYRPLRWWRCAAFWSATVHLGRWECNESPWWSGEHPKRSFPKLVMVATWQPQIYVKSDHFSIETYWKLWWQGIPHDEQWSGMTGIRLIPDQLAGTLQ